MFPSLRGIRLNPGYFKGHVYGFNSSIIWETTALVNWNFRDFLRNLLGFYNQADHLVLDHNGLHQLHTLHELLSPHKTMWCGGPL